jgi:hypothetical protein
MSNNSYTDDAIYEFVKLSLPQHKFDFENGAHNRNSLQECEHTRDGCDVGTRFLSSSLQTNGGMFRVVCV